MTRWLSRMQDRTNTKSRDGLTLTTSKEFGVEVVRASGGGRRGQSPIAGPGGAPLAPPEARIGAPEGLAVLRVGAPSGGLGGL